MFVYLSLFVYIGPEKPLWGVANYVYIYIYIYIYICTCPAGLGLQGKGKCNHVGGVLFAIEDFSRRGLQQNPEPLTCTSRLSVWVVPRNQSVAAKPLDKVLMRKLEKSDLERKIFARRPKS